MTNQDDFLRLRNLAITHMSVNPQFKGGTILPLTSGVESYHYKGNSLNFQFVHGDKPYIRIYLKSDNTKEIIEEKNITTSTGDFWSDNSPISQLRNDQELVEFWLGKLRKIN